MGFSFRWEIAVPISTPLNSSPPPGFPRPGRLAIRVAMSSDPLACVNACWARVSKGGIYKFLLSDVDIVSAEKGLMTARLKVEPNHINSKGGLHGSTSATIVDW